MAHLVPKPVSRRPLLAVALSGASLAAGCVMPDDLSRMQKDVADVRQQMADVQRAQATLVRQVEEALQREAEGSEVVRREEVADLQLRVEQFSREMGQTSERLNDLEQRLERSSQDHPRGRDTGSRGPVEYGSPPPSRPVDGAPPAGGAVPDPEALYNTAYADFSKGNYALAVAGFQEYGERFPQSALADNALYWIAECRFGEGDYLAAIDALDDLLGRYPDSDKAAAANLKKALAFQEQNQIQQAIIQYRYVVSEFPGSDEARLARDKLAGLGSSPH